MNTIGILALQGDFEKHEQKIIELGDKPLRVKTLKELAQCDGLIIPGGESTTLIKLMKKHDMWNAVIEFSKQKPVYGTCAGCILAAKEIRGLQQDSLQLIDIAVQRNAYGRQVDSFIDDIKIQTNGILSEMEGVFIRAPKIMTIGNSVTPLAWHNNDVILAEQGNILVGTFHPELTDDARVHKYFLLKVQQNKIETKDDTV